MLSNSQLFAGPGSILPRRECLHSQKNMSLALGNSSSIGAALMAWRCILEVIHVRKSELRAWDPVTLRGRAGFVQAAH